MSAVFEDRTGAEVASLRQRRFRTGLLLAFSIAMIPLSFVIPCGLGIALKHVEPWFMVFGVIAIVLPAFGLGGAILMFRDRSRYARSWEIARFALDRQFSYARAPEPGSLALSNLQVFSASSDVSANNLVRGKIKGRSFTIVDYSYFVGFGQYGSTYTQTVLVLHDAVEGAPIFVLHPRGWMDRLSESLGGSDIKIPDEPEFNKLFTLSGVRKAAIVERFSAGKMIDYCLDEPALAMEVNSDDLILFRDSRLLPPGEYEDFLKRAVRMASILRGDA